MNQRICLRYTVFVLICAVKRHSHFIELAYPSPQIISNNNMQLIIRFYVGKIRNIIASVSENVLFIPSVKTM